MEKENDKEKEARSHAARVKRKAEREKKKRGERTQVGSLSPPARFADNSTGAHTRPGPTARVPSNSTIENHAYCYRYPGLLWP